MAELVNSYPQMSDLASKISNHVSGQIDHELTALQEATQLAQQNLFWQTLLLVPMTLAVVGVFTYLFGRPIRAIDRSINELGRGTFSRPIAIRGPADLERLAAQLEWLRVRLLELAQEKNRFLRHMSHELKTPLANIREGTELLMDGAVGELQSAQREVTAILRENGMKLQRLIENLLSFSAWQAKSVGLEVSEFKLRPLIKSVLENQQLTLVAQRVRLDVQVEDLTPLADRAKCVSFSTICSRMRSSSHRAGATSRYTPAASANSSSSMSSIRVRVSRRTSATGYSRRSIRARRLKEDTSRGPESACRW